MIDSRARAHLYAFFSRLFIRELDEPLVAWLRGELGRELLPRFSASDEATAVASSEVREALFAPDFIHLTVIDVVPYESFYRRDDAMIESGLANPVVRFYRQYGFEADLEAARALSPDHLGIELELMAALVDKELEARQRDDDEQVRRLLGIQHAFMRDHLLAWAPVYLLAVQRNARTLLYGEASEALLELLLRDFEELTKAAEG